MFRFPEFYMEMKWDALIVFRMVSKPLIQKKLSFRETGKNTEKPNGKLKSECRKTELLRTEQSCIAGKNPASGIRNGVKRNTQQ
jgi:hypothetical protein